MSFPFRRSGGSGGGGRLVIAVVLVLISVITYYSQQQKNPVTGETQHVSMSPEQEVALGLQAAPEMAAQYGG
ncbi:MAG: peptidase M48 Ste24p [bacterium]|nr:MAG: peptidase M48 Ste24p [bacterium]